MPDPVALAQAGPVAILIAGIIAMVIGFVRGDVVPGWLYRQERAQRQIAETQAERNAESLSLLAKAASRDQKRRDNDAPP